MAGAFPPQQILSSMPNGQSIIPLPLEILSVSSHSSFISFLMFWSFIFIYSLSNHVCFPFLQYSCTHQVKIQWFKSLRNPTTHVNLKIQYCTWTMATLFLTLLKKGIFTSLVENQGTVKRSRSCTSRLGMCLLNLLLMVPVRCLILHHLIPLFLAQSHNRLLLHRH